jgi:hypothetical protein
MINAFSRDGPKKVYVQHRLKEHAKDVNELLLQKAYFYVCGDAANMAREVNTTLAQIMAEQRGIPESKAEEIVKSMRSSNQYQVLFHFLFRPFTLDLRYCTSVVGNCTNYKHSIKSDGCMHINMQLHLLGYSDRQRLLTTMTGGCLVIEPASKQLRKR